MFLRCTVGRDYRIKEERSRRKIYYGCASYAARADVTARLKRIKRGADIALPNDAASHSV
jgi:hypothetical protein